MWTVRSDVRRAVKGWCLHRSLHVRRAVRGCGAFIAPFHTVARHSSRFSHLVPMLRCVCHLRCVELGEQLGEMSDRGDRDGAGTACVSVCSCVCLCQHRSFDLFRQRLACPLFASPVRRCAPCYACADCRRRLRGMICRTSLVRGVPAPGRRRRRGAVASSCEMYFGLPVDFRKKRFMKP